MSRLRFTAPDVGFLALRAWDTRECCLSFSLSKRWTVGASYIRYVTAEPHRTVHFFMVWMSVDKWIRCGLPTGLDKRIEDPARQARALDAGGIAAVDDRDARVTRGGDRRLFVGFAKIRRHLDDDRLVRRLSHRAEDFLQL